MKRNKERAISFFPLSLSCSNLFPVHLSVSPALFPPALTLWLFYHSLSSHWSVCLLLPPPPPLTVFQATLGNYNLKWQNGDHHHVTSSSEMKWPMKKAYVCYCGAFCVYALVYARAVRCVYKSVCTLVVHLLCCTSNSVWHLPSTVRPVSEFLSESHPDAVRGNVV